MSSRALRRAQREMEEQERMKQLEQDAQALEEDDENEEGEGEEPIVPARKSAFAMLQEENDEAEDDEDEEESQVVPVLDTTTAPAASKSSSKKRKKKKKKAKAAPMEKDEDIDEIDAAIKQLAVNGNASQSAITAAGVDPVVDEANRLLSIDTNHLHAQNEMRRLFGRAALQHEGEEQHQGGNAGGNRRQQRHAQQVGLGQALRGQRQDGRSGGLAAMALRRNIFIQGKEDWPVATGGGLGMEVEEKRADGTVLYRFVHNTAYRDVQSQFETCVESMDPDRLVALLRLNPYHISTLLQVSEIAKQDRDHATSGDLLERALFSFGRAIHSTFAKHVGEGKARLDFRRQENREFWLASWRYMQNLTMRATWRTVYEWAKLLLSLSPEDDPYALWLVLDQYALRSRQDLDFLNLSNNPIFRQTHHMPNIQLSRGLAEYRAGNQGKGKQSLFTAIGRFPWVVARLMQELNIDAPPAVWGKEPRSSKEQLYAEMYATRAKDLWNTPETTNLLIEIASAIPPDTPAAPIDADEITRNEARHVLLSDAPALIALVPRNFTTQLSSSSDPLQPRDAYPSYVQQSHNGQAGGAAERLSASELQEIAQELRSLAEWFDDLGTDEGAEGSIAQQLHEMGVSQEEFGRRYQRFAELHRIASLAGLRLEEPVRPHQARVEDAPDEDFNDDENA